jgi:sugar diacid utilization regulator
MSWKDERYKHDIWRSMIARCYDETHVSYKYYGAKGIKVCDRWKNSMSNFWEDMGERPSKTTLDRIDSRGDYEPGNCRWATAKDQNNNKSDTRLITWDGKTQNMTAWAKELGMSAATLHYRLAKMKLPVELAFKVKVSRSNTHKDFSEIK